MPIGRTIVGNLFVSQSEYYADVHPSERHHGVSRYRATNLYSRYPVNATSPIPPFHLAFPVHSIDAARAFYGQCLGCKEGRSDTHWVDFDLYGHQIVAHFSPDAKPVDAPENNRVTNPVDGHNVPVPHFGVVLPWLDWHQLADRLKELETNFLIEPTIRFAGKTGEQATMFFTDPSGNALEFKAFKDPGQLFATD